MACAFSTAACVGTGLVVPERDLARELGPETEALKAKAAAYCRDRGAEVGRVQMRLKRTGEGEEVTMEAHCDAGGARFECTMASPNAGDEGYNCTSIPP